ncbi:hypothetical protein EP7_000035 [Isosphaeraceae bacterium EP7]
MRAARFLAPILAASWASSVANAQPVPNPARPAPDFRVVFWFDARGALRHQAYDLRKGEYTKAVDDWVSAVRYDAHGYAVPGPMATLRNVRLSEEPGANEPEKLAAAIVREGRAITRGLDVSRLRPSTPLMPRTPERRVVARPALPPLISTERYADPGRLAPLPAPFPFPVPYPRPHP